MIQKDINGNELKVGDRIVCLSSTYYEWLVEHKGVIVEISYNDIGIKWDETIEKLSNGKNIGHDCSSHCQNYYGWYLNANNDSIQLEESYNIEHIKSAPFTSEELDFLLS